MTLFAPSIKKKDIGDFFQKMSLLLDTGYDACSAAKLLSYKPPDAKRLDKSADALRRVAELLLPDLEEGFQLHEAMESNPKYFREYSSQIEVGESSGKTAEVMLRIYEQIKNSGNIMERLRGALTYPIIVLALTFGVAIYLFTNVVPNMLSMLSEISTESVPATTRLVMNIGEFLKAYGIYIGSILLILVILGVVYAKTIGRMTVAFIETRVPLIGKIIQNNSMAAFFRNWQQMALAGAEMAVSLRSAAEAAPNDFIRAELISAQEDYADNGVACYEALRPVFCIRELELQTIQVAMESNKLGRTLGILADDRELEANRSVNALTTAINPIMLVIVGIIVGVLVLAIYQPIISVSSAIT